MGVVISEWKSRFGVLTSTESRVDIDMPENSQMLIFQLNILLWESIRDLRTSIYDD